MHGAEDAKDGYYDCCPQAVDDVGQAYANVDQVVDVDVTDAVQVQRGIVDVHGICSGKGDVLC